MQPGMHRIRPAREDDLPALYEMAKLTGGGFTNLPADRPALRDRLAASDEAFARTDDSRADEVFVFVLEAADGRVRGTCQVHAEVGQRWPFLSYRMGTLTQHSRALGRSFRAETLNLVTDLEGASEVGGLFLHPGERAGGLGLLLARARYLFIAAHRARFADRLLAELRGVIDEGGRSPFWDGVAGRFLGMSFAEADAFNAINGHHAIAELMPRHPIYTAMLPEAARGAIGVPHPSGRAAMRMLEAEGFAWERYLDIFDGGPTMTARTDAVTTIARARRAPLAGTGEGGGGEALVAAGRLGTFRAVLTGVGQGEGGVVLSPEAADALAITPGDALWHVPRVSD